MNEMTLTIAGNVGDAPVLRVTPSGHKVANFSVAATPRRFDREKGTWIDGVTSWFRVSCWRALGENVAVSLERGQPVIVTGRFQARQYQLGEQTRVAYELEATAVGHDLSRGTAAFSRRTAPSSAIEVGADGMPADVSHHWNETDPVDELVAVDPRTGEVQDPFSAELAATG